MCDLPCPVLCVFMCYVALLRLARFLIDCPLLHLDTESAIALCVHRCRCCSRCPGLRCARRVYGPRLGARRVCVLVLLVCVRPLCVCLHSLCVPVVCVAVVFVPLLTSVCACVRLHCVLPLFVAFVPVCACLVSPAIEYLAPPPVQFYCSFSSFACARRPVAPICVFVCARACARGC